MPPRGALPGTFAMFVELAGGLSWKHCVLKYCCTVCGAFSFGSQIMFGLLPATSAEMLPRPAASKLDVVAVNGRPDSSVTMVEVSQPPSAWPRKPSCFWKKGRTRSEEHTSELQ